MWFHLFHLNHEQLNEDQWIVLAPKVVLTWVGGTIHPITRRSISYQYTNDACMYVCMVWNGCMVGCRYGWMYQCYQGKDQKRRYDMHLTNQSHRDHALLNDELPHSRLLSSTSSSLSGNHQPATTRQGQGQGKVRVRVRDDGKSIHFSTALEQTR
jgi:hypothetical protein